MSSLAQVPEECSEDVGTHQHESCRGTARHAVSAIDEDLFNDRKCAKSEHPLKVEDAPDLYVKRTVSTQLTSRSTEAQSVPLWKGTLERGQWRRKLDLLK